MIQLIEGVQFFGAVLGFLEETRILNCNGGLAGDGCQQVAVTFGKNIWGIKILHAHRAQHSLSHEKGGAHPALCQMVVPKVDNINSQFFLRS